MTLGLDGIGTESGAVIDPTGVYRYRLWRSWEPEKGTACFVMLNPSTADQTVDDRTIRRCLGFTRRWGYGRLEVVNLYALRATDPFELGRHDDPVGPDNSDHVDDAVRGAAVVVAAWGAWTGPVRMRTVSTALLPDVELWCLGTTRNGSPRHPLYVRGDTALVRWS